MNKILIMMTLALAVRSAEGSLVMFDFASTSGSNQTGLDLDGLAAGSSTVLGVTLTATANSGVFNLTASPDFGINASASGDLTDALDAGSGVHESMTFSFSPSVPSTMTLVSIDFDKITGSGLATQDAGNLSFVGGSSINFDGTNVDGADRLTVGEMITAGQSITLSHVDGNGFGLEAITLDIRPTAIPEPLSGPIWLGLLVSGMALFRWKTVSVARR